MLTHQTSFVDYGSASFCSNITTNTQKRSTTCAYPFHITLSQYYIGGYMYIHMYMQYICPRISLTGLVRVRSYRVCKLCCFNETNPFSWNNRCFPIATTILSIMRVSPFFLCVDDSMLQIRQKTGKKNTHEVGRKKTHTWLRFASVGTRFRFTHPCWSVATLVPHYSLCSSTHIRNCHPKTCARHRYTYAHIHSFGDVVVTERRWSTKWAPRRARPDENDYEWRN